MRFLGNLLTFIGFVLAIPGLAIAAIGQMLADEAYDNELEARYR